MDAHLWTLTPEFPCNIQSIQLARQWLQCEHVLRIGEERYWLAGQAMMPLYVRGDGDVGYFVRAIHLAHAELDAACYPCLGLASHPQDVDSWERLVWAPQTHVDRYIEDIRRNRACPGSVAFWWHER